MRVINVEWSILKTFIQDRGLIPQRIIEGGAHIISAFEGPIGCEAILREGKHDTEITEYETLFLSIENKLSNYKSGRVSVTTGGVEAKVGALALVGRTKLNIYNDTSKDIYVGPSGLSVTNMKKILINDSISLPNGPKSIVTLKIQTSPAVSPLIQEWSEY